MMTIEDVKKTLDAIREEAADCETAHGDQDELVEKVLRAIAVGAPNAAELAKATIAVYELRESSWKALAEIGAAAMSKPRTDAPKPPPFPVGTRLRCRGLRGGSFAVQRKGAKKKGGIVVKEEDMVTVYGAGVEGVVVRVAPGCRGTGDMIDLGDGLDPFPDETKDGYSVFEVEPHCGRCIFPDGADDWEVL